MVDYPKVRATLQALERVVAPARVGPGLRVVNTLQNESR